MHIQTMSRRYLARQLEFSSVVSCLKLEPIELAYHLCKQPNNVATNMYPRYLHLIVVLKYIAY